MRRLIAALVAAGCEASPPQVPPDAYVSLDAPAREGAGPGGGLLPELYFAVVGDTRPANIDDTAGYPTDVIRQIWRDVATEAPAFAVTTGDYNFASTNGSQVGPQYDLYLGARTEYAGFVYPAMGNHECNGYTRSNCGPGAVDGSPPNYTGYISRFIEPIGEQRPYYIIRFAALDGSWSAKLVFIAANAWTATQAAWLDVVLGEPTTYTFAVRHEQHDADAPGVAPSAEILAKHPLTLLIVGHSHTYRHVPAWREIIVGNGGAPLTSDTNYGYVLLRRQPDGSIAVSAREYISHAEIDAFRINSDGLAVQ